jgi:hypothetical protein
VEGVPAGRVSVAFPYAITADMIGQHARTAQVVPGKITEVRFVDTSGDWDVACRFVIGDGSAGQFSSATGMGARRKVDNVTTRPPMFRVELIPMDNVPLSFCAPDWEELDEQKQIVLRDVHPGRYRLVVDDWLMSIGFRGKLFEKVVDIKPGGGTLSIPLGAGSITGGVQWTQDYREMVHVLAVGKKTRALRHARCDSDGNFCLRYLAPDTYVVFAHDYDAGWRRLPDLSVKSAIYEVGVRKLVPGGTITGTIPPRLASDLAVTVVATDSNGISIERPWHDDLAPAEFSISSLWPGKWTVSLKKGEQVLTARTVVLRGVETARCDLPEK